MRIDLAQLSLSGLTLEMPAGAGAEAKRVVIDGAESVRGAYSQVGAGFKLSDVAAARLLLAKLEWLFGKLSLRAEQGAELVGLAVQAASDPSANGGELALELRMTGLSTARLELTLGALRIAAQVQASGLSLQTGDALGVLRAEHAVLSALEVRTATLAVSAPSLNVSQLVVDWGGDDFRLEAAGIESGELAFEQAGIKLRGNALAVSALRVVGSAVQVERARFARLDVQADLPSTPTSQTAEKQPETPTQARPDHKPLFDYELLNGLAGRLDVDVAVDLAVPIIGRRRATHELRVAIEDGALDYRELEHNLARLEDSLLDFSVRDGALVLERGLPLIATRGRGKPIVLWDLDADDLALAEARRVRLAVLPKARLAASGQSEPPSEAREEGGSSFKLLHLSLQELDAALRLSKTQSGTGAIRELTFDSLSLRGTVHHDPDGPTRAGQVRGTLEGLQTTLRALPLGSQRLALGLALGAVRDVDVSFEDVKPRRVVAVIEGLELSALTLA